MELLCFYIVVGVILNIPKLSSGVSYNEKATTVSRFACYRGSFLETGENIKVIKLYLLRDSLRVDCHLYDAGWADTKENRKRNLQLYTAAGLAPSIQIFNSTYSEVFYFKMTLKGEVDAWSIEIPRERITFNTDVAPVEEWFVKFNLHHGLNMFTTEGTLLDILREPVIQWVFNLGHSVELADRVQYTIKLTITKSPCANDVAMIGVIYSSYLHGIIIGISETGFSSEDTLWFDVEPRLCAVLNDDCSDFGLVDIILTNTHLIILTSLGLFISEDLRNITGQLLEFKKPQFCGFERDDYLKARIWYSIQCLANKEDYEVDYISLTFNKDKTLSQESTCFFSSSPFQIWNSCLPDRTISEKKVSRRVVSFLVDSQQNTGIAVLSQQNKVLVSVHKLTDHKLNKKRKFPAFQFPDPAFVSTGMFFHPNSHFLYVYGNQVWLSNDGGNTFELLIKLVNETIVQTDACVYSQAIIFATDKNNIFFTKAGLHRYAKVQTVRGTVFNMYFDHLGTLYTIFPDDINIDSLRKVIVAVNKLLQRGGLGFNGALAPQYITEQQIIFFNHVPLVAGVTDMQSRFSNLHIGKALVYKSGGSGIITKVFEHGNPPQFSSSILVDVLERYPVEFSTISPCTLNTLMILEPAADTKSYKLQLGIAGANVFKQSDVEKTVVIPGSSSFLITKVVDDLNALGDATMPATVPLGKVFESGKWFLCDFGSNDRRKWNIVLDKCRYTIHQLDDLSLHAIKYLDVGSTLNFMFRVTPVNTAYRVFHMPLMNVIVGKPSLLVVNTEDYWDTTDSYIMKIHVHSKFFVQGKTSIAVIVTQASLVCDVTTIVLTLKSSCSYLKTMHYVLPVSISASEWLSGENNALPNASDVSRLLIDLPVNYRPPSRLGIAAPLTENFYNADPSKPRMRDYFQGSKTSGQFKQCANKVNRSECGCTKNMKLSFSVAFSDCKEKALRMKYPVSKLPLRFTVTDESGSKNLTSPYFITIIEVNNRTNWKVSGSETTSSTVKTRVYMQGKLNTTLYNPDGMTLSIYGSELFHFRVSTIPGVSFCNLFDEFQIYIDDAPAAFPGQYLISSISAIFIGGIVFVAFIVHVYKIQIRSIFKRKRRINKVEPKSSVDTVSTTSTDGSIK